ncbi:MAG: pilus assembly protein PilP [Minicystis sp.]
MTERSEIKMKLITVPILALSALVLAGCGGDDVIKGGAATATPGAATPQPPGATAPSASASAAAAAASPTAGMPPLPLRDFQERDFAESDANRDPFRSFAADLVAQSKTRITIQRKVLVDRYALEELKLVGLVTGNPSRALLIDPTGLGWVAKVGDFVGKPELVHSGGPTGTDVPINWRVDRIRGSDVVFVREDPSHPEIPPTTRVIALRAVEDSGPRTAGITAADKN